jgi:hypothetical protein
MILKPEWQIFSLSACKHQNHNIKNAINNHVSSGKKPIKLPISSFCGRTAPGGSSANEYWLLKKSSQGAAGGEYHCRQGVLPVKKQTASISNSVLAVRARLRQTPFSTNIAG